VLVDADNSVRSSAAQALGWLRDPQATVPLIAALVDTNSAVRSSAAQALSQLGAIAAIPLISSLAKRDHSYGTEQMNKALVHLAPTEAVLVLNTFVHRFHRDPWPLRLRGHAFARLGDNQAALVSFKQAVDQQKSLLNLLALAHLFLEHGNLTEARTYADQALKLAPKWAVCLLSQAVIDWLEGNREAVRKSLAEALHRDRRIANAKDLQFEHFWGPQALAALEQMITAAEA